MGQGQVWQFERDRPSKDDDPRTPYRVVVSADCRLPLERRWGLTAPIVSTLDVDTPVAVRLQPGDPAKGFIRADELTRTHVPWLTGPVGMITPATLDALAAPCAPRWTCEPATVSNDRKNRSLAVCTFGSAPSQRLLVQRQISNGKATPTKRPRLTRIDQRPGTLLSCDVSHRWYGRDSHLGRVEHYSSIMSAF